MAAATLKQAKAVLSELHWLYRWMDKKELPDLRTDDNGWTDGRTERQGYFIMWEEGPYEWVYTPIDITVDGVRVQMQAVCGWGLAEIYNLEDES
jgi:hypothetical protein